MSVEAPKTVEETPAVTEKTMPTTEPTEHVKPAMDTPAAETSDVTATPATADEAATEPTQGLKKGDTVVEASPASEGVLGYKEPGFLKQLRFSKHFFWVHDEPMSAETLKLASRTEKSKVSHEHSAWARETGQGLLFFSKRAEDKPTPSGIILLHDASNVAKEGTNVFSMKVAQHYHRFEAATSAERDSWVVAIQKKIDEAKAMKDDITSRDSYKQNMEEYAKSPAMLAAAAVPASKSERSKSKEAKKSLDATTATAATTEPTPAVTADTASASSEEKKKVTKKDRSQSRKRTSIFGSLRTKKEEAAEQKEVKKEEKEVAKEQKAEEKKEEKLEKKAEHHPEEHRGAEAAEATAAATAVPAVVAATEHKPEEREEDKSGVITPTDKKAKRSSVFGSLFNKKGLTSPSVEKSEKDVGPNVPAKDSEVPPVSETAPKIEEPIENKPIDTAAVTAPVDTVETPAASELPGKELGAPSTATETATTPKTEKKGGFMGFIKSKIDKDESKDTKEIKDTKEEKAVEPTTESTPTAAAVPMSTEATEPKTEITSSSPPKEETPVREKRRTSLFDKNQLQGKLGGLFRKPSKAVRPEESKEASVADSTPAATTTETPATEATPTAATEPEHTETKPTDAIVPDEPHMSGHEAVTATPEVKASA